MSQEEIILGGFDNEESSSDSELSETWSELGAQIFSDEISQDLLQEKDNPHGIGDLEQKPEETRQKNHVIENYKSFLDANIEEIFLKEDPIIDVKKENIEITDDSPASTTSNSTSPTKTRKNQHLDLDVIDELVRRNRQNFKCLKYMKKLGPNLSPNKLAHIDQIIELVVMGQGSDIFNVQLNRRRKATERKRRQRARETEEQRARSLEIKRKYNARKRKGIANETEEERLQIQNRNLQDIELYCEYCQQGFARLNEFGQHNKKFHPESYYQNGKYICEICGKCFKDSFYLSLHSRIHGEKLYKCTFENCTRSFVMESYLKTHIKRVHPSNSTKNTSTKGPFELREKIHLCETCGQGFSKRYYYDLHKIEHARLLAIRKEAHEKKIRSENPSKSDQEIVDILSKFWESRESFDLRTAPETNEEKKIRNRLKYIEEINKKGLKPSNESIEECLDRLKKERIEKIRRKRENETEEERAVRRNNYRKGHLRFVTNNRERYKKYLREYQKKRWMIKMKDNPAAKAKNLAYQRERWAKKTLEQKARRLESMKNYQQKRKRKNES